MIEVVKATPEDYDVICDMAKVVWPHTYSSILSNDQLDYMFEMMYSKSAYEEQLLVKNHYFLLAKDAGRYVGFASYELNYYKNHFTKIHKLYVLPYVQGRGVGNVLLKAIEQLACDNGNTMLTLNVNRFNTAFNFYLKAGFNKAGEEDINIGNGYLMEDYIMHKGL